MKRNVYSCLFLVIICTGALARQQPVTVDDIFNKPIFQTASISGIRFMNDGLHYTEIDSRKNILKKDVRSGEIVDTLLRADRFSLPGGKKIAVSTYRISGNENIVLAFTEVKYIYRFSYTCIPYTYDLRRKKLLRLSEDPVMNLSISPDGSKVAYVRGEDLYYRELDSDREVRITTDGQPYLISNGKSDWVYEETFSLVQPFQWDAGSTKIAYYRFDLRSVPMVTYPLYETTGDRKENFFYRYYRPGDSIANVSIRVYDLDTRKTVTVNTGNTINYYLPRIAWTANRNTLCIYRMPRRQDTLQLLFCDAGTGAARTVYEETSEQYVDKGLFNNNYFLRNGTQMLLMSEKSGWRHLYLYDIELKKIRPVTSGNFDVDDIVKIDEERQTLYFTAAYHSPMDRQLFAIRFDGSGQVQLTEGAGWHSPVMNRTSTYFIDTYSDINTPPVYTVYDAKGKLVRELKNNDRLKGAMKPYDLPAARFIQVLNRKGTPLNAWLIQPSGFDSTKQYPVLFMNYGGPGSQKVINQWGAASFWQRMLASRGYVIVCVDNTGTGFRGAAFKKETYGNLGMKEIQDQMDAARWLRSQYPWVNADRIGYWGWSFGGFMSSLAITLGADYFKTAIAVAPVTDWRFYQAGYAERYMGLLADNREGYDRISPIHYADKLKGKFLLIHGTGDDNVHFRNSVAFSKALMEAGKQFEQQYYPDKDHALKGGNTSFLLYTRMTDFILKNL